MKFGLVARLSVVVLVEVFARAFAQECPLDNAFSSGRKTGTINPSRMQMLGGLAASRTNTNVLWGHPAGAADRIFAIATTSKAIADFTLNRTMTDAEDIAIGPAPSGQYIYVADCGGLRSSVVIGRFREPLVDESTSGTILLTDQNYFTLGYPDGAHDARGLMLDPVSNDLYVVTFESGAARIYRATQQALASGNGVMIFVATVPIPEATAADISADGSQIAIRSATTALYWTRRAGQTIAQALATARRQIPVLDTLEFDGNSLAFAADGSGYYTTGQGFNPVLLFFERNRTRFTSGLGLATLDQGMMTEISGIAASRKNPGLLWVHNDGPRSELYLVDTNGQFFATFVFGQSTSDFEDIAIGPGPQPNTDYVYCGDIGDNASLRSEVYVFRFAEPRVMQPSGDLISAGETAITLVYPDGAHNAEALLVDSLTGDLFIATKETGVFRLYKATQAQLNSGDVVQLTLAQIGNFGPVSAGDISPDGSQIILRHENEARLWHRNPNESVEAALARASERIPVIGTPLEPNGEGVSFAADSKSYYTISEVFPPVLYFFTPLTQPSFTKLPEIISGGVRITVGGCEGSRIRLDASNNFAGWSVAGSSYITNGIATIDVPSSAQALFYRAVVDDP